MTILRDAYQLCKIVWESPDREKIRKLIEDLNSASEIDGKILSRRSSFASTARQFRAQILGYLVVDRDKSEIEKSYLPLRWTETLQDDERRFLAGVHQQFIALNEACIAQLVGQVPQCTVVIDPYSKFRYVIPDDAQEVNMIPPEAMVEMATSFRAHPGILIAQESAQALEDDIPEAELAKAINNLEHVLINTGPLNSPPQLAKITLMDGRGSHDSTFRYVASLVCLRASLAVLDELVFQALLTKKLRVLNEDNVIKFGSLHGHLSGRGISVLCQPDEHGVEIGIIGSFVLIRDSITNHQLDLCRVEFEQFQSSGELGDLIELHLREIDEYLNPFSQLLRNF